jgi:hypothetical protein
MDVVWCVAEDLLGSADVRTWRRTEPMSASVSAGEGQRWLRLWLDRERRVYRVVQARMGRNVTCRVLFASLGNYRRKFTEFWTGRFGCHVPGSAESCSESSEK